jgi:hypothetical protein
LTVERVRAVLEPNEEKEEGDDWKDQMGERECHEQIERALDRPREAPISGLERSWLGNDSRSFTPRE